MHLYKQNVTMCVYILSSKQKQYTHVCVSLFRCLGMFILYTMRQNKFITKTKIIQKNIYKLMRNTYVRTKKIQSVCILCVCLQRSRIPHQRSVKIKLHICKCCISYVRLACLTALMLTHQQTETNYKQSGGDFKMAYT